MATILIADDHKDLRSLMSIQLKKHGFSCIEAADGQQVLELLETEPVDLILMDMNMPELDGWQATTKIRAGSGTESVPVIALTAYSMDGDRARALAAGCNAFHTKPIEFECLLEEIQSLLSSAS